jgi:hypothetical protein
MLDENARLIEVVVAKQNEGKVGASLLSLCSRSHLLSLSLSPPPAPSRLYISACVRALRAGEEGRVPVVACARLI